MCESEDWLAGEPGFEPGNSEIAHDPSTALTARVQCDETRLSQTIATIRRVSASVIKISKLLMRSINRL
jgi:hypothetical protein